MSEPYIRFQSKIKAPSPTKESEINRILVARLDLYIQMQYCPNKTLRDVLESPERDVRLELKIAEIVRL